MSKGRYPTKKIRQPVWGYNNECPHCRYVGKSAEDLSNHWRAWHMGDRFREGHSPVEHYSPMSFGHGFVRGVEAFQDISKAQHKRIKKYVYQTKKRLQREGLTKKQIAMMLVSAAGDEDIFEMNREDE